MKNEKNKINALLQTFKRWLHTNNYFTITHNNKMHRGQINFTWSLNEATEQKLLLFTFHIQILVIQTSLRTLIL